MTQMNLFYLISGFTLGFLTMLLIHVSSIKKMREQSSSIEDNSPKVHVPKYAAGSDIDSIRYHYEDNIEPEKPKTDVGGIIFLILITPLIVFIVAYCYREYF